MRPQARRRYHLLIYQEQEDLAIVIASCGVTMPILQRLVLDDSKILPARLPPSSSKAVPSFYDNEILQASIAFTIPPARSAVQ